MSIGKKYGNAVARNKIKRQVRSIIRENQNLIDPKKWICYCNLSHQANQLQYQDINKQLVDLLIKTKIMETKNEKTNKILLLVVLLALTLLLVSCKKPNKSPIFTIVDLDQKT